MLMNLSDILSQEGKVLSRETVFEQNTFTEQGISYSIIEKSPVALRIENQGSKKIRIQAQADVKIVIPCGRCLEETTYIFHLNIDRDVDMRLSEKDREEALDEHSYIAGNELDLDKLIDDEILVSWPMKVLCRDDCKGICNTCGANKNRGACECEPTDLDPRMAAIQDVFSKFKEV